MGTFISKNKNKEVEKYQTISSLRKESLKIFRSINLKESIENTLQKYSDAIRIDNTNEDLIMDYIYFLHSIQKEEKEEKNEKEEKKEQKQKEQINSKEELKLYYLFYKPGKEDLFKFLDNLILYENKFENKVNFFDFLINEINCFENIKYKNNLPILRKDNNLYYCKLYERLVRNFYKKYKEEIRIHEKELKQSYENFKGTQDFIKDNNNLKTDKYCKKTLEEVNNIYFCDFFNNYIKNLSEFLKKIKIFVDSLSSEINDYLESNNILDINDLHNKKLKLLENFLYYIQYRPFSDKDNPLINGEYYIFNDSILKREAKIKLYSNDNIKITKKEPNDENIVLIYFDGNPNPIIFNDKIYSLGNFCYNLENHKFFDPKKINFSNFDSLNIFRKNWDYTKSFIKDFFKSNLMKQFMNENDIYDIFNCNNQQILNEILEEVYFYPFICQDFCAFTNPDNQTIYLQGITNFNNNSITNFIIFYAFQLISLLHELLHFYFNTMRYVSKGKEKYNSPKPKHGSPYAKRRKAESGEWFEEKFFGKKIDILGIEGSIFILKMNDYTKNLYDFQKEFLEISKTNVSDDDISKIVSKLHIPEEIIYSDNIDLDSNISTNRYDNEELSLSVGEDIFYCDDLSDDLKSFKNTNIDLLDNFIEKIEKEIIRKIKNKN